MKYSQIVFSTQIRTPGKSTRYADDATTADGYVITRTGDDVTVWHENFGHDVIVVPWSNVRYAVAAESELGRKK